MVRKQEKFWKYLMTLCANCLVSSLWNIFAIELHASSLLMLKLRVTSQSVTMALGKCSERTTRQQFCAILFHVVTHLQREIHKWTDQLLVILSIAMVDFTICLLCPILYSFKLYLNQLLFLYWWLSYISLNL